jgi:hypothetical protein
MEDGVNLSGNDSPSTLVLLFDALLKFRCSSSFTRIAIADSTVSSLACFDTSEEKMENVHNHAQKSLRLAPHSLDVRKALQGMKPVRAPVTTEAMSN